MADVLHLWNVIAHQNCDVYVSLYDSKEREIQNMENDEPREQGEP
jgi:hypothetical protein